MKSRCLLYVTTYYPFDGGEYFLIPEHKCLLSYGYDICFLPVRYKEGMLNLSDQSYEYAGKVFLHSFGKLTEWNFLRNKDFLKGILPVATKIDHYKLIIEYLKKKNNKRTSKYWILRRIKNLFFVEIPGFRNFLKETDIEHIHSYWAVYSDIGYLLSRKLKVDFSFTVHRFDFVENPLIEVFSKRAKFIRFISKSGLDYVSANYPEADLTHAVVLHLGVPVQDNYPSRQFPTEKKKIIVPANLVEIKGHIYLLEAVKDLAKKRDDFEVEIFGEGNLENFLKKFVDDNNLNNIVKFYGRIRNEELLEMYRSDGSILAVVLPSIQLGPGIHEGIPVALMEAMSYGIPVISTKTGGIPELVDESSGILIPDKNPAALKKAINELLDNNELWYKLSKGGYEKVKKEFNIKIQTKKFVELIES